jgi:hypothetical protein
MQYLARRKPGLKTVREESATTLAVNFFSSEIHTSFGARESKGTLA